MTNPELLKRIVRHLIVNYPFVPDMGLLNGKMGGAIFFSHYAAYCKCPYYKDIAHSLIDGLSGLVNDNTPVNFFAGLSGIGWGIEYMIQNGLLEGDTDEILEDIDRIVMQKDVRRISDQTLYTGLGGILYYVITRLESHERKPGKEPFDSVYLDDLYLKINNTVFSVDENVPDGLIMRYNRYMNGEVNYNDIPSIEGLIDNIPIANLVDLSKLPIGIKGGLTGMALKLMV